jgi:hypothetical protein
MSEQQTNEQRAATMKRADLEEALKTLAKRKEPDLVELCRVYRGELAARLSGEQSEPDGPSLPAADIDAAIDWMREWPTDRMHVGFGNKDKNNFFAHTYERTDQGYAALREALEKAQHQWNCYFLPNNPRDDVTVDTCGKPSRLKMKSVVALFCDVDGAAGETIDGVHAHIAERRKAMGTNAAPSFVNVSGGGIQNIWKLQEPVPVDEKSIEEIELRQRKLAEDYGGDPLVIPINSYMRLPGTINVPHTGKRAKGRKEALAYVFSRCPLDDKGWKLGHFDPAQESKSEKSEHAEGGQCTPDQLAELLSGLKPEDFQARGDWLPIMFSAHAATNGDGVEQFVAWSTADQEYATHGPAIRKEWSGLKPDGGVTIGTLIHALDDYGQRDLVRRVLGSKKKEEKPPPQMTWVSVFPFETIGTKKREWVIENYAERGVVNLLAGHGGAAKSLIALNQALACVFGKKFGPWQPRDRWDGQPLRVAMVNMEDDLDEVKRRIEAALKTTFKPSKEDDERWAERLMLLQCETVKLVGPSEEGDYPERTAAYGQLLAQLKEMKPDLVIFDPLVEFTIGIDENSAAMHELHAAMRNIARETNAALLLIHHFAKSGTASNQNAARGSSTLTAGSRFILNVERANDDDVGKWKISEEDRGSYIKTMVSKANYAKVGTEQWFRTVSVVLENGDTSVALEPWAPQPLTISLSLVNAILDDIVAGRGDGLRWSYSSNAKAETRAADMMMSNHGLSKPQAWALLKDLLKANIIGERPYKKVDRKPAVGIEVLKRPEVWPPNADVHAKM